MFNKFLELKLNIIEMENMKDYYFSYMDAGYFDLKFRVACGRRY